MGEEIRGIIDTLYRAEWGRILATIIRYVGDFDAAEEATQEAFTEAFNRWPETGVPQHPRAWLIQTARHMAIDRIRRKRRFADKVEMLALEQDGASFPEPALPTEIPDDRLRLIFTCCHPALSLEAQLALTLRTLGGLETEEIARAFLVPPVTMAQRIVRAKKKIAEAGIPYVVPETSEMPERLHAVLTVLYLVFTEGYAATRGESLVRSDLSAEAIRLARVVCSLMAPNTPREATGLLALLLLQDSRRTARVDAAGDVVVLDDQDRSLWNDEQIAEALPLVDEAMRDEPGPFALQAAIAAVHARARKKEDTDWPAIVRLYDLLEEVQPSAVVSLNRAAAVAMAEGPRAGLALMESLEADLDAYHLLHAARADLFRRLGERERAAASYMRALMLAHNESERRFLEKRLREVSSVE